VAEVVEIHHVLMQVNQKLEVLEVETEAVAVVVMELLETHLL
jgi:hypothetical protein